MTLSFGAPRTPADRVERVRAWVEAFTVALEAADLDAIGRLFAVECSWQPGPFVPAAQGRAAIRELLAARLAGMPGLDTRAESGRGVDVRGRPLDADLGCSWGW